MFFFMNIPIKYASNTFCESEVTENFVVPKFWGYALQTILTERNWGLICFSKEYNNIHYESYVLTSLNRGLCTTESVIPVVWPSEKSEDARSERYTYIACFVWLNNSVVVVVSSGDFFTAVIYIHFYFTFAIV
jgi:hypothetical protein